MQNVAVIDLVKLRQNAISIKESLPPGVKFIAVVKADGYGHGAEEVANAIHDVADCFAVALLEEALSLRYAGVKKDILVLVPPFKTDIEKAVENNVTLAVDDYSLIEEIDKVAHFKKKIAKIELIVNTGMNRFGFNPKTLILLLPKIKMLEHISVRGVFSHFFHAENLISRHKQSKTFSDVEKFVKDYFPLALSHISASGGFIKGEYYDAVRIGILLYGYYPFKANQKKFSVKPVMSVYSPVIKDGFIKSGEHLLYGKYMAKEDERYSLIRYGYADGLPRKQVENMFNNRCMDVSAIKNQSKSKFFCILSQNADEIAKKYDTISYEVLTSIARRSNRVYIR